MGYYESPELSLEPPEPEIVATCDECCCLIVSGEVYGRDDMGNVICRDCLDKEWFRISDDEAFELLGYEVIK